jgi:hypothetical protein
MFGWTRSRIDSNPGSSHASPTTLKPGSDCSVARVVARDIGSALATTIRVQDVGLVIDLGVNRRRTWLLVYRAGGAG